MPNEINRNPKVGQYANRHGWSDIDPFEIIAVTPKTITIRSMLCELDKDWKPEQHVGGFCAHTSNNHEQKWIIKSDPKGGTEIIHLNKKGWGHIGCFRISDKPIKFYDFNF